MERFVADLFVSFFSIIVINMSVGKYITYYGKKTIFISLVFNIKTNAFVVFQWSCIAMQ